ncbi:hypothetical protein CVT24_010192 [Panaeolus cyanescens]|uniref:G domain-containing protein n=1 Tax=Panaeolus cyanescens TaxID=181874 RepID=A0A409YPY7_9AGAR|nr:hypothetical protein CVT24_010192 [Panaeolus cyanescens]
MRLTLGSLTTVLCSLLLNTGIAQAYRDEAGIYYARSWIDDIALEARAILDGTVQNRRSEILSSLSARELIDALSARIEMDIERRASSELTKDNILEMVRHLRNNPHKDFEPVIPFDAQDEVIALGFDDRTSDSELLGVTGSGKSSFIEALASSGQRLGISGSTLDSVTQEVEAFKVINIDHYRGYGNTCPVFLVDTPGFLDARMSEVEVVEKIEAWMGRNGSVDLVFYFGRINDKRMTGRAWRLMTIIKNLRMGSHWVGVVTTMWDMLHGDEALKRAEDNFAQLRDDVLKVMSFQSQSLCIASSLYRKGTNLFKFQNTQLSAIEIVINSRAQSPVYVLGHLSGSKSTRNILVAELRCRIENLRQHRQSLQEERTVLLTRPNPELEATLRSSLRDIDQQLTTYICQVLPFDSQHPEFASFDIKYTSYRCLMDVTLSSQRFVKAIENTLGELPSNPSNWVRRAALKAVLRTAKDDVMRTYDNMCKLVLSPPELQPFNVLTLTNDPLNDAGTQQQARVFVFV